MAFLNFYSDRNKKKRLDDNMIYLLSKLDKLEETQIKDDMINCIKECIEILQYY